MGLRNCPWVPVWKLESLAAGREEGMKRSTGREGSSRRLHHREFSREPPAGTREKPSGEQEAEVLRALVFVS